MRVHVDVVLRSHAGAVPAMKLDGISLLNGGNLHPEHLPTHSPFLVWRPPYFDRPLPVVEEGVLNSSKIYRYIFLRHIQKTASHSYKKICRLY
jgi:hypothetical protein